MLHYLYFFKKENYKKLKEKIGILKTLIQSSQVTQKITNLQNLNYPATRSGKREGVGEDGETPQTKEKWLGLEVRPNDFTVH